MTGEKKPGPAGTPGKKPASNDYLGAIAIIAIICVAIWLLGSTIEAVQTFFDTNISPALDSALYAFVDFLTRLGKGDFPTIAGFGIFLGIAAVAIAFLRWLVKK